MQYNFIKKLKAKIQVKLKKKQKWKRRKDWNMKRGGEGEKLSQT